MNLCISYVSVYLFGIVDRRKSYKYDSLRSNEVQEVRSCISRSLHLQDKQTPSHSNEKGKDHKAHHILLFPTHLRHASAVNRSRQIQHRHLPRSQIRHQPQVYARMSPGEAKGEYS